jgi:hypothetical protein
VHIQVVAIGDMRSASHASFVASWCIEQKVRPPPGTSLLIPHPASAGATDARWNGTHGAVLCHEYLKWSSKLNSSTSGEWGLTTPLKVRYPCV